MTAAGGRNGGAISIRMKVGGKEIRDFRDHQARISRLQTNFLEQPNLNDLLLRTVVGELELYLRRDELIYRHICLR
jgi:hypothetical protein